MTGIQRENLEGAAVALQHARDERDKAHAHRDNAEEQLQQAENQHFIQARAYLRACNAVVDETP